MTELKHIKAIRDGDFSGLPIADGSTAVNMTGSWKFFRPALQPKKSPCNEACPLKIEIADYMRELAVGNYPAALEILRRRNPLPAVTGRVCPHFCQGACNRTDFDTALLIGDIERALGDFGLTKPYVRFDATINREGDKKAAIIGSGPAGLAAAVFLAREGVKVTIFEQADAPGGLLRYGIPAYRLPREILNQEIENIIASYGIELRCGRKIEKDKLNKLNEEYDAIIAAPGLGRSIIPPSWPQTGKIIGALEILAAVSRNKAVPGQNFVVIGGGNAALDAARSLKRLGKTVKIIYRRSLNEMPAYPDEIREAVAEGLLIEYETVIEKIVDDGNILTFDRYRSRKNGDQIDAGDFLASGSCDFLIAATGQESDGNFTDCGVNFLTAGDFAHGAASVAEALASGREAAAVALREFAGSAAGENDGIESQTEIQAATEAAVITSDQLHLSYYAKKPALKIPELDEKDRGRNFAEVRQGLSLKELEIEAGRCFSCGSCTACGICWFFCPDVAITINPDADKSETQILFDYDHCKGCGQCAEVCPRGVIGMEEDL